MDKSAYACRADSRRHDVAVGFGGAQFYVYRLFAGFCRRKQGRQVEIGVGASHEVHAVVLDELALQTLRHASYHAYDEASGALAAQRGEILQARHDFLLRVVANGTGV